MPKQMRMPAQAETIKRSLPADVAASVIFVEPVAFRSGEFAFFVITQSEILKCDLSANISSRYPFTKVASIDRSSEADTHKLFDSAEYQADVAKYSIRVTAQEASVPEVTDFYSYCHDSQLYFHMRQAWWHARLVRSLFSSDSSIDTGIVDEISMF